MKGVLRSKKNQKLIDRYVGPYEILKCIGSASYEFKLSNKLVVVFHV